MAIGSKTGAKHLRAITTAAIACLLAVGAPAAPDSAKIAAISELLDRLHADAAKADGDAYFALFAKDAVFIGTDAAERWPVPAFRAYALPLFASGKGWTYRPRERHVSLAAIPCGCVAWFDELLDSASYGTSRGTGVVTLTADGWKIAQYALTFPIPNALAVDITSAIKSYESKAAQPGAGGAAH